MARKFSTALRNLLLGLKPSKTGTGISFVNATKTFADTGNGLNIFRPDDKIVVSGSVANNGTFTVVTVAAGGGSLTVSESVTDGSAGPSVTVALHNSKGFKDIFREGVFDIYSGSQPTDGDSAETGTKLVRISDGSGAFTPGTIGNGLEFGDPSSGVISKSGGQTWSGVIISSGTAGWFRFYDNLVITGAGATATYVRFDGSVSTSGAQLNLSSVTMVLGATLTIDTFQVTLGA